MTDETLNYLNALYLEALREYQNRPVLSEEPMFRDDTEDHFGVQFEN